MDESLPQIPSRAKIAQAIAEEREDHVRRLELVASGGASLYDADRLLSEPFLQIEPSPQQSRPRQAATVTPQCPFNWGARDYGGGAWVLYQRSPLGTINGWLPTNTFDGADTRSFAIPSGVSYLVLSCTASGAEVTNAVYQLVSSAPDPIPVNEGTPPSSCDILVAVAVRGTTGSGEYVKVYRATGCGQLSVVPKQTLATSRPADDLTCGADPYLRHWTWIVTFN